MSLWRFPSVQAAACGAWMQSDQALNLQCLTRVSAFSTRRVSLYFHPARGIAHDQFQRKLLRFPCREVKVNDRSMALFPAQCAGGANKESHFAVEEFAFGQTGC